MCVHTTRTLLPAAAAANEKLRSEEHFAIHTYVGLFLTLGLFAFQRVLDYTMSCTATRRRDQTLTYYLTASHSYRQPTRNELRSDDTTRNSVAKQQFLRLFCPTEAVTLYIRE